MEIVCETCGNPIAPGTRICPFCNRVQEQGGFVADVRNPGGVDRPHSQSRGRPGGARFPVRSIKDGQPDVEEAMARLLDLVSEAHDAGVRVLTVVHGYGSGGVGGSIRQAARQRLRALVARGIVEAAVHGEDFVPGHSEGAALVARFPELAEHGDWGRGNEGVTLVVC